MLQIQHTLVSLDLIEKYFVCDLDACLGACCIEGDAGAPLAPGEAEKIERILPEVENDLLPRALEEIRNEGASYTDPDGDLVTQIVDGRDCVYTCYAAGGKCLCALEKAFREGRIPDVKPISCRLYPVRLKEYDGDSEKIGIPNLNLPLRNISGNTRTNNISHNRAYGCIQLVDQSGHIHSIRHNHRELHSGRIKREP